VGRRVGERADHLGKLGDGAGPAVGEEQRQRLWTLPAHMDEVDVQAVYRRGELGQPV
jgi:hypothetical protein